MECIANFFVALETHPIQQTPHGNRIVTAYAGRAQHEWFDALKRDEGFNLAIINPDLIKSVTDEIKDFNRDKEIAAVSIYVTLSKKIALMYTFFFASLSLCAIQIITLQSLLHATAI